MIKKEFRNIGKETSEKVTGLPDVLMVNKFGLFALTKSLTSAIIIAHLSLYN